MDLAYIRFASPTLETGRGVKPVKMGIIRRTIGRPDAQLASRTRGAPQPLFEDVSGARMSPRRAGRLERAGKAEQRGGEYMRVGKGL